MWSSKGPNLRFCLSEGWLIPAVTRLKQITAR
nr:MAG TPA: hypothetical protein [Caudoviricetes sp.]